MKKMLGEAFNCKVFFGGIKDMWEAGKLHSAVNLVLIECVRHEKSGVYIKLQQRRFIAQAYTYIRI